MSVEACQLRDAKILEAAEALQEKLFEAEHLSTCLCLALDQWLELAPTSWESPRWQERVGEIVAMAAISNLLKQKLHQTGVVLDEQILTGNRL